MTLIERGIFVAAIIAAVVLAPERVGHLALRASIKVTTAYYHIAGHGSAPDAQTAAVKKIISAGSYKGDPYTVEGFREHIKFEILMPLDVNAHSERVDAAGTPAIWVGHTPSGTFSNATELDEAAKNGEWIMWFHGGGYAIGTVTAYAGQIAPIARAAGAQLLLVDYPLLPEAGSLDAIKAAAMNGWKYLTETRKVSPKKIIVAGDSAGGNLAVHLSLMLKAAASPFPAGLLLDSPWVEFAFSGKPLSEHEFVITKEGVALFREIAKDFSEEISVNRRPAEDFAGFPATRVVAGEGDGFYDKMKEFHTKLGAAGANSTFDGYPKMPHVFMSFFHDYIPDGATAAKEAAKWMKDTWKLAEE